MSTLRGKQESPYTKKSFSSRIDNTLSTHIYTFTNIKDTINEGLIYTKTNNKTLRSKTVVI